jgi:hypothetical protein
MIQNRILSGCSRRKGRRQASRRRCGFFRRFPS